MTKPIVEYRVKCMYSKHYFKVKIFNSKKDLYAYYAEYRRIYYKEKAAGIRDDSVFGGPGFERKPKFAAIVMPYEKITFQGKKEIRGLDIGEALFYKRRLGVGLITHEMLHCSLWHDRLIMENRKAIYNDRCGEAEERLAYTLTGFVADFVHKYYKSKIHKQK